jgi:hypothetical protein
MLAKDLEIAEYLCSKGADLHLVNLEHKTPMMLAVEGKQVEMVSLLCKYGGYSQRKDNSGRTIDAQASLLSEKPLPPKDQQRVKMIQTIVKTCKQKVQKRSSSVQQILKDREVMIKSAGTVFIPSQKTGQCYSDSFQAALYYADGFCHFFIDNALKQKFHKRSVLPIGKEDIQAYLAKGKDIISLYIDFTGYRFKNMVESHPVLEVKSKGRRTLKRRPSLSTNLVITSTGEVCSSVLHMYDEIQRGIAYGAPYRLDFSDIGNLREDAELMFWNAILKKIPYAYGSGGIYAFDQLPEDQEEYVVAILFSVFPYSANSDSQTGHAISLVKIFGNWYLCDDNIGFASPINLTISQAKNGTFFYKTVGTSITYYIGDKEYTTKRVGKPTKLMTYDFHRNLQSSHLTEYDFGGRIHLNSTIGQTTRKYITWDPKHRARPTEHAFRVMKVPSPKLKEVRNGDYSRLVEEVDPAVEQYVDKLMAVFRKRNDLNEVRERRARKLQARKAKEGNPIVLPEDLNDIEIGEEGLVWRE